MNKPSHKQIVKILAREIYEEKLKPGDKLEPLRELSKKLGADQTSLRIALKHLEFLNLLEIKRSD
ncbi:MAG: GntR family transcriptional regulator, partial [Leptospiraceae bacterium]|nr:GntR family transcriptional regulator [Leptospiraceae bacterium]